MKPETAGLRNPFQSRFLLVLLLFLILFLFLFL